MSYLLRYIESNVRYTEDIGSFFRCNIVMKIQSLEGSPFVSKKVVK